MLSAVLRGGSSYVSDKIFGQNEQQSWAFGNLRGDNDFADVTLACEDDQQVDAPKMILAEQARRSSWVVVSLALVLRWEGGDGRHWLILGAGVFLYLQEQELLGTFSGPFVRYFLGTFSGTFQGTYPRFEFRFRSMFGMKLETRLFF